jgi:hypothetical protein
MCARVYTKGKKACVLAPNNPFDTHNSNLACFLSSGPEKEYAIAKRYTYWTKRNCAYVLLF